MSISPIARNKCGEISGEVLWLAPCGSYQVCCIHIEQKFAEFPVEERYAKHLKQEKRILEALLAWLNDIQIYLLESAALLDGSVAIPDPIPGGWQTRAF